MKNIKFIYLKITLLLAFIVTVTISCEREVSDDVEFASYSNTGEIFIDGFMGGLDYFPFGNSFAEAFSVDEDVKYKGTASMRFDIPVFGVGYGGATFPSTGPRDLSGYDALTFWAKASQGADINNIGFGINGDTKDKYKVTLQNLPITTQWKKYIIPIPDASKLFAEKGMFWYSEGAATASEEGGYTFWIDELKFEKLGTIAQPQPAIFFGEDIPEMPAFLDDKMPVTGLTQTFNLGSGINETVLAAPSYFSFSSSDIEVARVSELGIISIVGSGTATITATLGGVKAAGSLKLKVSEESFVFAPEPTHPQSDVISLFSDTYTNVYVDNFNPYWEGSQTQGEETTIGGGNIISYTDLLYVAVVTTTNPIDATDMTYIHLDLLTPDDPADFKIKLKDFGGDGVDGGGDDTEITYIVPSSQIVSNQWISLDIPLSSFVGLNNKAHLGFIIFESQGIDNVYIDNIYYHK